MPVSIRLGAQVEDRLTKASRKLGMNKTDVIKRSLEAYLNRIALGRTPYERAEALFGADQSRGAMSLRVSSAA
jgi:ribbon-helix-helix CopG family protein